MVLVFSSKWAIFFQRKLYFLFGCGKKKRQTKDSDVSVFWEVERAKAHCFVNLGKKLYRKKKNVEGKSQFILDSSCG